MRHPEDRIAAQPIALVADDDAQMRNLVGRALEGVGFHVLEATNGAEAEELASKHKPDVAIVDIVMPRLSGLQLVLRWRNAGLHMGVIVLTSDRDVETTIDALDVGADDCLFKPVYTRELVARVGAVVRRMRGWPTDSDGAA